ncbi:putative Conserved repeat domain-containing protein [Burkholderiales bacterium 8X]|nr:putative Conserved repeat domain-containing protein [Burkholderiales bacterium 8X]
MKNRNRVKLLRGLAAASAVLAMASLSSAAMAAPGIPAPASVVFLEDFENRFSSAMGQTLRSYTGSAAASNMRYSTSPWYSSTRDCNGLVFSRTNAEPFNCSADNLSDLRKLADEMAKLQGLGAAAANRNSILLEYTYTPPINDGDGIVLETVSPVSVQLNRFYTLNLDVVDISCIRFLKQAQLNFFFLDGALQQPLNSAPLTPCASNDDYVGAMKVRGALPYLSKSGSLKLLVKNAQFASDGNDFAFDNLAVLDVTPKLDKEFARGPLKDGAFATNLPARMTFTITNRDDLLVKSGWQFVETLPVGLKFAPLPNLTTTCSFPAVPLVAPRGTLLIARNGTLPAGARSCTISVDVTSDTAGTYTNTPANVTGLVGLDPPSTASITFIRVRELRLQKALGGPRDVATDQFIMSVGGNPEGIAVRTTTGSGASIDSLPLVVPLVPGTTYSVVEGAQPNVLPRYQTSYACTNAAAGGQTPTGVGANFSFTATDTDDLNCTFTNTPKVDLAVSKLVNPTTARTGQNVTYTLQVVNNGPAAVDGAVLRDQIPATGLDCSVSSTASCTASNGAVCPGALVSIGALTGTGGLSLPRMPASSALSFSLQCKVTASGT